MQAVAKRIKAEREKQGRSIAEMANILSVSEQEVSDLENGTIQLTMRDIDLFSLALEVSADKLKFGDDFKPSEISQSHIENPSFKHSNVATNTATTMTTNNYYTTDNAAISAQMDRIEKATHKGRLGAETQLDRMEEQIKLLLERVTHLNEKVDFLLLSGEK